MPLGLGPLQGPVVQPFIACFLSLILVSEWPKSSPDHSVCGERRGV